MIAMKVRCLNHPDRLSAHNSALRTHTHGRVALSLQHKVYEFMPPHVLHRNTKVGEYFMRVMPVAGACAFALFSTVQFSSRHRSTLVIRRDAAAHESLLTMQFFARIAAGGNRSLQPAPKLQNQVCCFEKTRPCSNIPQRVPRCYKIVLHGQYVCLNGSILGECQLVLIVVQSSFWGETRQLVTTMYCSWQPHAQTRRHRRTQICQIFKYAS